MQLLIYFSPGDSIDQRSGLCEITLVLILFVIVIMLTVSVLLCACIQPVTIGARSDVTDRPPG